MPDEQTQKVLADLFATAERRSRWYGHWYFASVLQLGGDGAGRNVYTVIYPQQRDEPAKQHEVWEYGSLRLCKGSFSFEETRRFLISLTQRDEFQLPGHPLTQMVALMSPYSKIRFSSQSRWLPSAYPFLRFDFNVQPQFKTTAPRYDPVYSPRLPIYPSAAEAVFDFCGVRAGEQQEASGDFLVALADYRARIRKVKLSSSRVTIEYDCNDVDLGGLRGKLYFSDASSKTHRDFPLTPPGTEIEVPGFPQRVIAAVVSDEGEVIDDVQYSAAGAIGAPGIELELSPADLEQIVLAGESETLEFKRELPKPRQDIAISVVAMANRKGGRILLGVDKEAVIVGFTSEKPEETLRNILREYCDPPLEPTVELVPYGDKLVLAITVAEGTDKPYCVKEKGPYIRSGSTNRVATRYELDQMYKRRGGQRTIADL